MTTRERKLIVGEVGFGTWVRSVELSGGGWSVLKWLLYECLMGCTESGLQLSLEPVAVDDVVPFGI